MPPRGKNSPEHPFKRARVTPHSRISAVSRREKTRDPALPRCFPGMMRTAYILNHGHPHSEALKSGHPELRGSFVALPDARAPERPARHCMLVGEGPSPELYAVSLNRQNSLERKGLDSVAAPAVHRVLPAENRAGYRLEDVPEDERLRLLRLHRDVASRLRAHIEDLSDLQRRRIRKKKQGSFWESSSGRAESSPELDERDKLLLRWLADHGESSQSWFRREEELFS